MSSRRGYAIQVVETMMVNETLVIVFDGEPPIQGRPRGHYLRSQARLIMYDPMARVKRAAQILLRTSLEEIGLLEHGANNCVFDHGPNLKVKVTYFIHDNCKDTDNLLKFTLDVMQSIVFDNDRCITEVVAKKVVSRDSQARADVEVSIVV